MGKNKTTRPDGITPANHEYGQKQQKLKDEKRISKGVYRPEQGAK